MTMVQKDMSAYDYVRVKVTSENEMNCRTYNGNDHLVPLVSQVLLLLRHMKADGSTQMMRFGKLNLLLPPVTQ